MLPPSPSASTRIPPCCPVPTAPRGVGKGRGTPKTAPPSIFPPPPFSFSLSHMSQVSHFWKLWKWKDASSSSFEDSRDKKGEVNQKRRKRTSTSVAISADVLHSEPHPRLQDKKRELLLSLPENRFRKKRETFERGGMSSLSEAAAGNVRDLMPSASLKILSCLKACVKTRAFKEHFWCDNQQRMSVYVAPGRNKDCQRMQRVSAFFHPKSPLPLPSWPKISYCLGDLWLASKSPGKRVPYFFELSLAAITGRRKTKMTNTTDVFPQ